MIQESYTALNGDNKKPAYGFLNDDDTGFYLKSVGTLGISVGGVEVLTVTSTGASFHAVTVNETFVGTLTIKSTSASAFSVGANGATDPVLKVNANTGSVVSGLEITGAASGSGVKVAAIGGTNEALHLIGKGTGVVKLGDPTNPALTVDWDITGTGLSITSAAAGSRVAVAAISSGTDEGLSVDAKGAGTIRFGATSTGAIEFSRAAVPTASDGAALGTTALMWSDLFLASGGVINFNNGNVTLTHSTGLLTNNASLASGSDATDRVTMKGIYKNPLAVAVAVPSITDPDIARVQVSVAAAFSMQPAIGDVVIAIPTGSLPTNCRLQGAFVYATDGVEIVFGSEGGNVTGANVNFDFLVIDLT